jgi:hypothetical protein
MEYGRRTPNHEKEIEIDQSEAQLNNSFGIKDALKSKGKAVSLSGDVLFKDVQLFIPELIINIALFVFGVLGIVLLRLLSAAQISGLKELVSGQAFEQINSIVGFQQTIFMVAIAIPILISLLLFGFKWFFFYPRGNKAIVIRAWKTGLGRFSIEELKDGGIKFDNKPDSDVIPVPNPRKSWDFYTNRPIILLEEGQPSNTSLHRESATSEKINDEGNVKASVWNAAMRYARYQLRRDDNFWSNPTNILLLVIIIGVIGLAAYMLVVQPDSMTGAVEAALSRGGR